MKWIHYKYRLTTFVYTPGGQICLFWSKITQNIGVLLITTRFLPLNDAKQSSVWPPQGVKYQGSRNFFQDYTRKPFSCSHDFFSIEYNLYYFFTLREQLSMIEFYTCSFCSHDAGVNKVFFINKQYYTNYI